MRASLHLGFTLIELMIALVILALLAVLAVPMYGEMLANTQIRNASESILMGLRQTQAEAIRLNAPAKFTLATSGWQIQPTDPDANDFTTAACTSTVSLCVKTYQFAEGADKTKFTSTPGDATEVTFNGLGQIVANTDGNDTLTQVDVTTTVSSIASPKTLRILVGTSAVAAGMKMCDPSYPATDPVGCPTI